ncbi:hypothetical protein C8R46DRAFT_1093465 [Mycena filopes]|nr:hypothetical protein C8R46DRAFT_1093465 [Mycena filopes]
MAPSGLATDDNDHAGSDRVKGHLQRLCTNCGATASNMRRCGRCKRPSYCSKECQVENWPIHRSSCKKFEESDPSTDPACPVFDAVLQAGFIFHFTLIRFPRLTKVCHAAIVDFAIEPVELADFVKIFNGEVSVGDEKGLEIMGMVQINSFLPKGILGETQVKPWRESLDTLDLKEFPECSVGLLKMRNLEIEELLVAPIIVWKRGMDLVEGKEPWDAMRQEFAPWTSLCPQTGEIRRAPFNILTCLEFLNNFIRADTRPGGPNDMSLGVKMRPCDFKTIRDAGAGSMSIPARLLRAKMAREDVFKPLRQHQAMHQYDYLRVVK